jgi:hypothetical protein
MKSSKNTFFKVISTVVIVFAMVSTTNLNAQGPPGGQTDTQDEIPLDGGLIALLIGAAAFGVKKLRDKKQ